MQYCHTAYCLCTFSEFSMDFLPISAGWPQHEQSLIGLQNCRKIEADILFTSKGANLDPNVGGIGTLVYNNMKLFQI